MNIISVDVEDYFHAANLDSVVGPAKWRRMPQRVDYSTRRVLDLFARCDTRGTFFVLGYVAARWPDLVKDIAAAGHEVASHGYNHRLAYELTPRQFYRDVYRSKRLLEDLTGSPVLGYRAPNFSIREGNSWAYDALIRAGYIYDSSLFPVWHPRYDNRGRSTQPAVLERENGKLLIFPLAVSTLTVLGRELRLPVAGGAYWRLLPRFYSEWGLRRIGERKSEIFNCYLHPWELDEGQPVFSELPFLTRLRHYDGVSGFERRVEFFLRRFAFGPLVQAAADVFGQEWQERLDARAQAPGTSAQISLT